MPTPNYVYLLKNGTTIVYPKTKISAIDMTLCNGLEVSGETLYLSVASALQVKQGSTGRIVTAEALKTAISTYSDALYVPGEGINISAGTFSINSVTVAEAIAGDTKKLTPINNKTLNGAINLGRAVDVSSDVDLNNFDSATISEGVITLTKSSASSQYYYYGWNTHFPKFASGLKYLIMADVKNTGDAVYACVGMHAAANRIAIPGVTISANAAASESSFRRFASCFTADGGVSFFVDRGSSTNLSIQLKNFKVFEVTALNDDAIYALATSENPDEVYEKFLIQQDAVCPWISTINMGNSPALTIGAGLSYRLTANDGATHDLYIDTFPDNSYGREAYLTIFVGDASYVQVHEPLILMDHLTPNAANNCIIRFRDGYARMYVSDTDYGYAVTVTSGTTAGTLYYGLITDTASEYITFAATTDETDVVVDLSAATVPRTKSLIGNGTDKTTIDFDEKNVNVIGTAVMRVQDASIKDGTLTSGTIEMTDGGIEGTFAVSSGGTLQMARTTDLNGVLVKNGGTVTIMTGSTVAGTGAIDYAGSNTRPYISGSDLTFSGITIRNGNISPDYASGGAMLTSNANTVMKDCIISGTTAMHGGAIEAWGGSLVMSGCSVLNTAATSTGGGVHTHSTEIVMSGCVVASCTCLTTGAALYFMTNRANVTSNSQTITVFYPKQVYVYDTIVSGNSGTDESGGFGIVYGYDGTPIIMSNCQVVSNYTRAAVMNAKDHNTSLYMGNCNIEHNSAAYGAWGYIVGGATITAVSCTIAHNSCTTYGGMRVMTSNWEGEADVLNMSKCLISGNYAAQQAGGIYGGGWTSTTAFAHINLSSCTFVENKGSAGAAMYLGKPNYTNITDCIFSGNSATKTGIITAAGSSGGGSATLTRCTVTGNTVGADSIRFAYHTYPVNMLSCTVTDNIANIGEYGAGVAVMSGCTVTLSSCTVSNNKSIVDPTLPGDLFKFNTGGGLFVAKDCVLAGNICAPSSATVSNQVRFDGVNMLPECSVAEIEGCAPVQIQITSGGTLNLTGNSATYPLSAGAKIIVGYNNNGTWTMGGSATIINSAGASVTISGSGTKLSNTGVLS